MARGHGGPEMKRNTKGFGGLQVLLAMATMGIASLVAVPQYESYSNRAKIMDVLEFADGSVQKASHFFIDHGSFPRTSQEAIQLNPDLIDVPGFISGVNIIPDESGKTVYIKIYLEEGVFDNEFRTEQYVYLEGSRSPGSEFTIRWRCGISGLNLSNLPDSCHV